MAALFTRPQSAVFKLVLGLLLVLVLGTPVALVLYMRTPDAHAQFLPVAQPIEFDHRHHVQDDRIDCLYCHNTAERSQYASVPSTELCMGCHNQIWNSSAMIAPIRDSYFTDLPIQWNRVHNLPDHVYFNHSSHVTRGVGCVTCHGRVDQMARVYKHAPLTMAWCLECHRNPAPNLRPLEAITDMTWTPPDDGGRLGRQLAEQYGVRQLTTCTTCHR